MKKRKHFQINQDTNTQIIHSFISPTNAQLICFKILKFTLKYTINAATYFGLTKPSSGSLPEKKTQASVQFRLLKFSVLIFSLLASFC
jgi:hypothetical protein